MAGGAADCQFWQRNLGQQVMVAKLFVNEACACEFCQRQCVVFREAENFLVTVPIVRAEQRQADIRQGSIKAPSECHVQLQGIRTVDGERLSTYAFQ